MTDQPDDPRETPASKPKPVVRAKVGGLAAANLTSRGGKYRSEQAASARSASKSKPWMSR